jgi:hypothetical protein
MTGKREEARTFFQETGIRPFGFFNILVTPEMSFGE